MVTIVNILWGDWPQSREIQKIYFEIFKKRLKECTTVPYKHVLFTDNPEAYSYSDVITKPLGSTFPMMKKNTAKVFPYKCDYDLEGQVFLIDVDFILKANIDDILSYKGNYAICRDYHPKRNHKVGGGIVSFPANTKQFLYDFVVNNYVQFEFICKGSERFFIDYMIQSKLLEVDFLQNLFPDKILSWKFEYKPLRNTDVGKLKRDSASMIACHGVPRPMELIIQDPYFEQFWSL